MLTSQVKCMLIKINKLKHSDNKPIHMVIIYTYIISKKACEKSIMLLCTAYSSSSDRWILDNRSCQLTIYFFRNIANFSGTIYVRSGPRFREKGSGEVFIYYKIIIFSILLVPLKYILIMCAQLDKNRSI